jgi:hypothetical protein
VDITKMDFRTVCKVVNWIFFGSEQGPVIGCGEHGDVTYGTENGKGI